MPQLHYYKNNLTVSSNLSVHIWISFLKCHHVLMITLQALDTCTIKCVSIITAWHHSA